MPGGASTARQPHEFIVDRGRPALAGRKACLGALIGRIVVSERTIRILVSNHNIRSAFDRVGGSRLRLANPVQECCAPKRVELLPPRFVVEQAQSARQNRDVGGCVCDHN
jgi:hypothetical protein